MGLSAVDWLVVAIYLALVGGVAWWARHRSATTDGYFLGGRSVPAWAAAISFMATALSAATFMGLPDKGLRSDLTYLMSNIGAFIAIAVVALIFVPAFYRSQATTVYGYLGQRYGPVAAWGAGVTFVLGRLLASGARLFIAGSALGYLLAPGSDDTMGIQIVAIIVLVIAAIAYVWIGGIRSVIWTDVLQAGVFVGGALIVIAILLNRIPLEFGEILSHLSAPGPEEPSKLTVVSDGFTDFSPSNSYSLLAILLGVSLINLGAYGTDQDLAQRLLTCKDSRQGSRSAIMAVLMAIPVSFLFIAIGMLLWFFYERPDLMADMAPGYERPENARVLAVFIVNELSGGLAGLLAAGLAAAAISSLTSEINAIAATVATDLYKPLKPQADDRQVLRVGRIGVPLAGAALAVVAIASIELSKSAGDVVDFALMVMMYAYAGLVAVFLCALCTPRGNQWSAVAALVVGFGWICLFQFTPLGSNLAFPYQMFFATLIAFIVCVCGNPRRPAH